MWAFGMMPTNALSMIYRKRSRRQTYKGINQKGDRKMKSEEISAKLGGAEDDVRALAMALNADEKWRSGIAPNEYTRYLSGLFLEATGKYMALCAMLDFMQKENRNDEIHGF
jgi:hypothetical protein